MDNANLWALIEAAAAMAGDRPALVESGEVRLRYDQLDAAVGGWARALTERGARPGDRIVVQMEKSIEKVQIEEQELVRAFIDGVEGVPGLRFFGPPSDSDRIGVFSVRIDGIEPNELANHLEEQFGLLTRAGLHCAPHIHETIGTASTGGTTRFSFSPFVTLADVKSATDALAQLAEAHVAV